MAVVVMVSHPALGSPPSRAARESGLHVTATTSFARMGAPHSNRCPTSTGSVVPRLNGDTLSFAMGMLLRRDRDREKTGRTLREALEKIDATE